MWKWKNIHIYINSNATENGIVWLLFSHENWNLFIYIISIIRMNETLSIPIGVGTDRLYKRMDFISIQHQIRNIFHCKLSVYTELHFHFVFVFPADGLPLPLEKSNDFSEFLSFVFLDHCIQQVFVSKLIWVMNPPLPRDDYPLKI